MTSTPSRIVNASQVVVGSRITETDTPAGPFYDVVKVNPRSLVVSDDGFTLRLPIRPTDTVRLAV